MLYFPHALNTYPFLKNISLGLVPTNPGPLLWSFQGVQRWNKFLQMKISQGDEQSVTKNIFFKNPRKTGLIQCAYEEHLLCFKMQRHPSAQMCL